MKTDVEELLRDGMERFTEGVRAPAGLAAAAGRRCRPDEGGPGLGGRCRGGRGRGGGRARGSRPAGRWPGDGEHAA